MNDDIRSVIKYVGELMDGHKWPIKTEWKYRRYDQDEYYFAEFVTSSNEVIKFRYYYNTQKIEIVGGPHSTPEEVDLTVAGWLTRIDEFVREFFVASERCTILRYIHDFLINSNMISNKPWKVADNYCFSKFNTPTNVANVRYYHSKLTIEITTTNPKYHTEEFELADPDCFRKLKDYVRTI